MNVLQKDVVQVRNPNCISEKVTDKASSKDEEEQGTEEEINEQNQRLRLQCWDLD